MIDLLDQIYGLLAGEKMERREFADILDSGLTEISVGTIPRMWTGCWWGISSGPA